MISTAKRRSAVAAALVIILFDLMSFAAQFVPGDPDRIYQFTIAASFVAAAWTVCEPGGLERANASSASLSLRLVVMALPALWPLAWLHEIKEPQVMLMILAFYGGVASLPLGVAAWTLIDARRQKSLGGSEPSGRG